MISLIDAEIGRLLEYLEQAGLSENTVVVFTADHGEMLGDHGLSRKGLFHYEPLIRVPLAISWPRHVPGGRRQAGIVQSVDLPTTMLDVAGVPIPHPYQGLSLRPWACDERHDAPRQHALVTNGGEGPHYDPWPELRTLVTDDWKLQYVVGEGHIELDSLVEDPAELNPRDPAQYEAVVASLLGRLVDAGSKASVWGEHIGRW
jgi:arylsulfatase A-like enzyme